jgi:hypothetical protein
MYTVLETAVVFCTPVPLLISLDFMVNLSFLIGCKMSSFYIPGLKTWDVKEPVKGPAVSATAGPIQTEHSVPV